MEFSRESFFFVNKKTAYFSTQRIDVGAPVRPHSSLPNSIVNRGVEFKGHGRHYLQA